MEECFEDKFSSIQKDMISICLEYLENKGDKIFIYASNEENCTVCNFFFEINGSLYKKHKLPAGYNVSIENQKECMRILNHDMNELIDLCIDYKVDVPTEIKLIYDIKNHHLNADYKYEQVYSNTEKFADDVFEEWFNEIKIGE